MCYIDCLDPYIQGLHSLFHILTTTHWSLLYIPLISLMISLFSGLVNYTLMDMQRMRIKLVEMEKHKQKKQRAKETADRSLWVEVTHNEERYYQLQKEVMMSKMLPQLITLGPLIFVYTTLRRMFRGPIALFPFKVIIPFINSNTLFGLTIISFGIWYVLSSICVGSLLLHIFGLDVMGKNIR